MVALAAESRMIRRRPAKKTNDGEAIEARKKTGKHMRTLKNSSSLVLFAVCVSLMLVTPHSIQAQCTRSCGGSGGGPSNAPTTLYNFAGSPDGATPVADLSRDASGNLYGVTMAGGITSGLCATAGCGVVYKLAPSGTETVLHSFTHGVDGAVPQGSLLLDSAGNLYGTTTAGGAGNSGVVFKLDPSGNETVLYSFTGGADGGAPYGSLFMDTAGNLYGTTSVGGSSGNGVIFKLDTNGNETVLYGFSGTPDGSGPKAGLIQDAENNFYGTTQSGGNLDCKTAGFSPTQTGCGTVFKLDSAGTETVLYAFTGGNDGSDGAFPTTSLVQDAAGNLYGTTLAGSPGPCYVIQNSPPQAPYDIHCGTVYKVDAGGTETILHHFATAGNDGVSPNGDLLTDWAGNLYGTTSMGGTGDCTVSGVGPLSTSVNVGCGTIYELDPSGNEIVLYSATSASGGTEPLGGMLADASGNLYGTTAEGGTQNFGTVFKFAAAISGISITPLSVTVAEGSSQTFTATVENDPNNLGVTWSIHSGCNFGPACYGTLTAVTPTSVTYNASSSTTAASPVTIVATSKANSSIVGEALVTVTGSVSTADFSLSPASSNLSAQPGGQVTDMITIAPQMAPFNSAVQLSCTVSGPSPLPTCALSATSVTPGSNSATTTLTVTAPVGSAALTHQNFRRADGQRLAGLFVLPIFAIVLIAGLKNQRHRAPAVLLIALAAGCGGGSGNNTGTAGTTSYTVEVTGTADSGAIVHTVQITVNVQ